MPETYSLFELNEHIRRVLALNFQEDFWVQCEISQVKQSRGHYYLELVEKSADHESVIAQSSAVIWARTAYHLERKLRNVFGEILQDGIAIRCKVRVDFHERYGLKLIVEDLDPSFTLGNIEARRRESIDLLRQRKLLEKNAQIPLPMVIQRIAILSAENAAGYHDFMTHLIHNPQYFKFWPELYPIAMQGVQVEQELVAAIHEIRKAHKHYDCVVIIRGGGSRMDLAGFDCYAIGEAIAECPLPVFTGIGHEIDHTVADAVAHTALKTPTAVADFIIGINDRYTETVEDLYARIAGCVQQEADNRRLRLEHLLDWIRKIPADFIARQRMLLTQLEPLFLTSASQQVARMRERLTMNEALLQSLDPELVLARGFSITTLHGQIVRTRDAVKQGDLVHTQLAKGNFPSIVTDHDEK